MLLLTLMPLLAQLPTVLMPDLPTALPSLPSPLAPLLLPLLLLPPPQLSELSMLLPIPQLSPLPLLLMPLLLLLPLLLALSALNSRLRMSSATLLTDTRTSTLPSKNREMPMEVSPDLTLMLMRLESTLSTMLLMIWDSELPE